MGNVSAMISIFHKGGYVMYILLLLSLAVIAIAVDRWMFFKSQDAGRGFAREFYELMQSREFGKALALARETKGSTAAIITEAAAHYLDSSEDLSSYLQIQSGIALSRFNEKLYFLSVVVTMSPLLGLLGTITGMIGAFSVLNTSSGAMAITGGVGEALIATASGIFVALVALVVHSYFKQRIEGIVTDMEQVFSELEAKRASLQKAGVSTHEAA